jgi:hypothetical protein
MTNLKYSSITTKSHFGQRSLTMSFLKMHNFTAAAKATAAATIDQIFHRQWKLFKNACRYRREIKSGS